MVYELQGRGHRSQTRVAGKGACKDTDLSYFLQWKRSFSFQVGLSSCRMTRVLKIFLPKLTTTNGSMSKLQKVVEKSALVLGRQRKREGGEKAHPIFRTFLSRGRSSALLISSRTTPRISESVE